MPPATMISLSPDAMACAATMMAFIPLAHTLLMVVASDAVDKPAPRAT